MQDPINRIFKCYEIATVDCKDGSYSAHWHNSVVIFYPEAGIHYRLNMNMFKHCPCAVKVEDGKATVQELH